MNIRKVLQENKISVAEIARRMGYSPQRMNAVLNSDSVRVSTLRDLAAQIGCNVIDFFEDEKEEHKTYVCGTTFVCPECKKRYYIDVSRDSD